MMKQSWEVLYDVLFQPQTAFRSFGVHAPVGLAAIIVALAAITPSFLLESMPEKLPIAYLFSFLFFNEVIATFLVWVVGTGVYHLVAELFGGRGRMLALFSAIGMAHLPRLVLLPLWALGGLLHGGLLVFWTVMSGIAVFVWSCFLIYYAVKETHQLSPAKSILVITSPFLAGLILVVFSGIFLAAWLSQLLQGLF